VNYTYKAAGATYAVDGLTRDFSTLGCGIRGMIIPPVKSKTRVKLYLPSQKLPLSLDATVIWVEGEYFGVQFNEIRKEEYARIRRYIAQGPPSN
jgi:hypothetical protein